MYNDCDTIGTIMNAKKIRQNLLQAVFKRTLGGDTNFYPEAREAIKEVNEHLKNENVQLAAEAATKTGLSLALFKEAKKSTSKKNKETTQS